MTHLTYSHLCNKRGGWSKRGGWNKRGGGAKFAKSLNLEVGINVEGGVLWKKLVHNSNKRGAEGGKNLKNQQTGMVDFFFVEVEIFQNR